MHVIRDIPFSGQLNCRLQIAGVDIDTVVDSGARASHVGKWLACNLGIWKTVMKMKVQQADGSILEGNIDVNTSFTVLDTSPLLRKLVIDVNVLDNGNERIIWG